jgi:hypothetical protein
MNSPPADAVTLEVNRFHAQSRDAVPRPRTRVGLRRLDDALRVGFEVDDVSLLATQTEFQASVCRDSCVEFFFKPAPNLGYFNIEVNCIGTVLAQHHPHDHRRRREPISIATAERLSVEPSLPPEPIDPERVGPAHWTLSFEVPFDLIASVAGVPVDRVAGPGLSIEWRGNFYKCADWSRSPHWASWAPINRKLGFHCPERFAPIVFDREGRFVADKAPARADAGADGWLLG